MGDTIDANQAAYTAKVLNLNRAAAARPGLYSLFVYRNGQPYLGVPIPPGQDQFTYSFAGTAGSRYRLQVQRFLTGVASIENVSSPIYQGVGPEPPGAQDCSVWQHGTKGDDYFGGTEQSDAYRGRAGDDRIKGQAANDCLHGAKGRDRVNGGSGFDELRSGRGADRINALDGTADLVNCGPGEDRAKVEPPDVVSGCEHVVER